MSNVRLNEDEYFMNIARVVARRSTCPRASVGCVVVKNGIILSTGYNGSPHGKPHCTDVGCIVVNNHCIASIHSEVNALLHANTNVEGSTIYCTHLTCMECAKLIINSGVVRVVYNYRYVDDRCRAFSLNDQIEYLTQSDIIVGRFNEYVGEVI